MGQGNIPSPETDADGRGTDSQSAVESQRQQIETANGWLDFGYFIFKETILLDIV